MKKRCFRIVSLLIGICVLLSACGNTVNSQPTYDVIKTMEQDGIKYDFEYASEGNCVTVVANAGGHSAKLLFFVNGDGAITSIYAIEAGRQDTYFEENKEGYPITTYNDAGGISSVEYEKVKFIFTYNNYVENELTGIAYSVWNNYTGWSDPDTYDDDETAGIKIDYVETTDSSYRMFNSAAWLFCMVDALEAVYDY